MADDDEKVAIGIDLGTTYSCVAVWRDGQVEIIANDQGNRTMPSYVAFTDDERVVGEGAKNQCARNPTNTVFDAKRLIGRNFSDDVIKQDMEMWPFKVVDDGKDKPLIEVEWQGETKQFTPEEISAMILVKMKETAEAYLGAEVKDAVITCPAYFNDTQRAATISAGSIAGLKVLRIINEPTAAAIAYGIGHQDEEEEKIVLVFDLGGGTFDVSVLSIEGGVFEVRATAGDTHLGGEDFDSTIMNYMVEQFKKKNKGLDPTKNPRSMRKLRSACEKAKRTLSSSQQATVEVDSFYEGIDLMLSISRARFEDLCSKFFQSCMVPVNSVLNDLKMSRQRVDELVMVGGSTRIPKIQNMIKEAFFGKEPNNSINPDEAVAYGAAVQAAILTGDTSEETENLLLIDVAPLSLGVETAGGMMSVLIKRNSTIPADAKKMFTTNEDNQTCVEVQVFEGERPKTEDNTCLGKFDLEGIPSAASGVPRIEVGFHLDASGVLKVSAEEKNTNKKCDISITNSGRLTTDDVDRLVAEAEKYKKRDESSMVNHKARLELEEMCKDIRQTINDPKLRINKTDYDEIEKSVDWVVSWYNADANAKKKDYDYQKEELSNIVDPILMKLYKGLGLAARNCGLMHKRRNEVTALLTDTAKKQKMLER